MTPRAGFYVTETLEDVVLMIGSRDDKSIAKSQIIYGIGCELEVVRPFCRLLFVYLNVL